MQVTLTGEEVMILFFMVVALYGMGWIVVNKIIPARIRRKAEKRRAEKKKKDEESSL